MRPIYRLPDGTTYTTPAQGEPPMQGDVVMLRDGRAAEIIMGPFRNGNVLARPWDTAGEYWYATDSVQPWEDPEAQEIQP